MSPTAYYNYLKNRKAQYHKTKTVILHKIVKLYHVNDGIPGYRMMRDYLKLEGIIYSYPTIYKYMKELGLRSIVRPKKPGYVRGSIGKVFPNLLNGNFNIDLPNKVWATDFTYLLHSNGTTRYNCTIIDLYERCVVATLNGKNITSQLAIDTLKIALKSHKPEKGLILHSDQGSQYTSREFREYCKKNHVQQSMSRGGCPYDNAPMERFYNTFKNEFFNIYSFNSEQELDNRTYDFIYGKYNHIRPHSFNNGLPPYVARYNR
jgi:transposase InsO family protein